MQTSLNLLKSINYVGEAERYLKTKITAPLQKLMFPKAKPQELTCETHLTPHEEDQNEINMLYQQFIINDGIGEEPRVTVETIDAEDEIEYCSSNRSQTDPEEYRKHPLQSSLLKQSYRERKEEIRYFMAEQAHMQNQIQQIVDAELNQQDCVMKTRLQQRVHRRQLSKSNSCFDVRKDIEKVSARITTRSRKPTPLKIVEASSQNPVYASKQLFCDDESQEDTEEVLEQLLEKQYKQVLVDRDDKIERIVRSYNNRINNLRQQYTDFANQEDVLVMMEQLEKEKWIEIKNTEKLYSSLQIAPREYMKKFCV